MKKAKDRIGGKRVSHASLAMTFRPNVPRRLSAFEKVLATNNGNALRSFLQENPQEDDDLWKMARLLVKTCEPDEFIAILLETIQEPSKYVATKYFSDLTYHNFPKCAKIVLDNFPVDINFEHHFRGSALTCAARMDSTEIAMMLLDVPGVDINVKNCNGRNPVWFAASNENKLLLDKLLEMGADSLQTDAEDTLPEQRTTESLATVIRNSQDLGVQELSLNDP